jgi:hypothetical protein
MADWKQQTQFLDYFAKHGITHVNLAVLCAVNETGKRLMKGDSRARDRAEAEKSLGWAWHENGQGGDVYVRPARWLPDGTLAAWPMLFLDDVSSASATVICKQYAAMVVETSPGRHHVWLPASRPLSEQERKALQLVLCEEYGGDVASVSGEHFGRAPGYKNNKRGGCWVNVKSSTTGKLYVPPEAEGSPPQPVGSTHGGACASHDHCDLYESIGGWSSESEREFGFVIGRLRWLSQTDPGRLAEDAARLEADLTARATARGKLHAKEYARRTVQAALDRLR